jgi:carbonic anhydrase/acetyltransferase-like protein (isoleucine patch superfamily)
MIYEFQGKKPNLHPTCFVVPSADLIGDLHAGANVSFWFNVTVRADVGTITIGEDTNIQDNSCLHVTHTPRANLTIGKGVTVGHSVTLHGCTIRDYCLIGMNAVILDHAEIGEESLIGAQSLVPSKMKIPPRSLVLGSPAKVVRELKPEEIEFLHQSAENYKTYSKWYRESGFKTIF